MIKYWENHQPVKQGYIYTSLSLPLSLNSYITFHSHASCFHSHFLLPIFFHVSYLTLFSLVTIETSYKEKAAVKLLLFRWCLVLSSSLCLFKELFHDNKTSQMHLALPWHLTWHFSNWNYAIHKQWSGHDFRPISQICGFCSNKQILR